MISVIIPAYNAEKTIARCLASVIAQNIAAEILVVDDGSTDTTLSVLEKYKSQIRLSTPVHGGVSAARNTALAAAKGEWIVFLDADDVLLPDALAKLAPYMTEDVDAVCGKICRGNERMNAGGNVLAYPNGHPLIDFVLADPTNYLTIHAWAFRRKPDMPRFDPDFRIGEDSDWVLRYLRTAKKAVFVPFPVYRYTVSADSTVHKWKDGQDREFLKMIAKLGRGEAGQEKNWPLFVLTNYLLVLTHVVFHPCNPDGRGAQFRSAHALRNDPVIADAFARADLSGLSGPKRLVLACLKRGRMMPAYIAVKLRQKQNARRAAASFHHLQSGE